MGPRSIHTKRRLVQACLAIALGTAALSAVVSAHAVAANCGTSFTDPAGDAANNAPGGSGKLDNLDIVSGGILKDDGQQITTQIAIKNLDMTIPSNATSINWYFIWTFDGTNYFGRARIDISAPTTPVYSYGTFDGTRFTAIDATTGAFNKGANGTVQVNVPIAKVGAPSSGAALTQLYAQTSVGQGVPGGSSVVTQSDRGPDSDYGTDYQMGSCSGASPSPSASGSLSSPHAKLRLSDKTPKFGSTVKATASLGSCTGLTGTKIDLQRKVGSQFKKTDEKVLDSKCKAVFTFKATFKSATFRSYWPKQNDSYRAGASKPQTVTTHA